MSILLNQTNISPTVTVFELSDNTEADNASAFNTAFYSSSAISYSIPFMSWGNATSFGSLFTIPNQYYSDVNYVYRLTMSWSIFDLTFDTTLASPNGTISVICGYGNNQLTPIGGSTAYVFRNVIDVPTPFTGGSLEFVFPGYVGEPLRAWLVNSSGAPITTGDITINSIAIAQETTIIFTQSGI
jgi:hypothetical protein